MWIRVFSRIGMWLLAVPVLAFPQAPEDSKLVQREDSLQTVLPRFLALNENIATGAQPAAAAFAKLATRGFRAVLSLRTDTEGVDLKKDRELTEAAGMRYLQIPVVTAAPAPERVEEFLRTVADQKNYPLLIYCGSANRVGALWMIYRVVANGWTEEKALAEAVKIGLTRPELKSFVQSYLTRRAPNNLLPPASPR